MASMAAAIAASRTAVMNGNRPLDDKERKRFTYFSSLSPMARKIMQDKEKIREKYGPEWERLPPKQQDEIIDKCMVEPHIQARYAAHRAAGASKDQTPSCYPNLRVPTGQKVVHFGDESQMDFSIASLSIQEPSGTNQNESRQLSKVPQGAQVPKSSQGNKTASMDGLGSMWKEEESSFWKINAERSRVEGLESDFQSLTPSQIKSMEKGEKVPPGHYRQESVPKDREVAKGERPSGPWQEKFAFSNASSEKEKVRSGQSSVGLLDDGFLYEPVAKLSLSGTKMEDTEDAIISESKSTQLNTSNVILKTGFDFLDNW
uniref:Chromosome 1 open reading frame 198 n=1 Tax=Sarcophilus harrisii TaxID=9305 RepID=A0A7N4V766_SARHA